MFWTWARGVLDPAFVLFFNFSIERVGCTPAVRFIRGFGRPEMALAFVRRVPLVACNINQLSCTLAPSVPPCPLPCLGRSHPVDLSNTKRGMKRWRMQEKDAQTEYQTARNSIKDGRNQIETLCYYRTADRPPYFYKAQRGA